MAHQNLRFLTKLALDAAKAGSLILLNHMASSPEDLVIRAKRDGSPVSAADLDSHRAIVAVLQKAQIPIISEEGHLPPMRERQSWPWYWLVDPLDGTESYLKHREGFAVNIALCNSNGPVIGVVADPLGERIFIGVQGQGAEEIQLHDLTQKCILHPRPIAQPHRLVTSWNESASIQDLVPPGIAAKDVIASPVSGALKFCLLATGEAEIHARTGPYMEWDCAAGDGILRAIGLDTFDRRTGQVLTYNSPSLRVEGLWVSRI